MGDVGHLLEVGGNQQHRQPLLQRTLDQPVNLSLGANVDPGRRLLENQHAIGDLQPTRHYHLLLITPAEGFHWTLGIVGTYAKPANQLIGLLPLALRGDPAKESESVGHGIEVEVFAHRHRHRERLSTAVASN
ncbi:hypothetical protein D9M72_588210 [compost metagenome]